MSANEPPEWLDEIDPQDYLKPFTELTAAGLVGFILGVNYTVGAVNPTLRIGTEFPAWVGQVEWMQWLVMGCLAVVVVAWIYLDYTEQQ